MARIADTRTPFARWYSFQLLMVSGLLLGLLGCERRNFYRDQADQEVNFIIQQTTDDPKYALAGVDVYMDPRSRYYSPYDPNRPPMPEDDPESNRFMKSVDGMKGYKGWEDDAVAQITFRFELYAKGVTEDMYRKTKDDPGLYFRAKEKRHLGKFRTPSLRYTKYTAPYMHNGTLETLPDVVAFYNGGGDENEFAATKSPLIRPLGLTDAEMSDLVAFLESLSGEEILMETPDLPVMQPLPPPGGKGS